MENNQPLVSVLMNCFNGEKYLVEALDSIMAQKYKNYEIVFIDNCSTDRSAEIANNYPIRYIKTEKNIPLGEARNIGLQQCQGSYVAFLDTDDIWMPNALEKLVAAICSGNYALAYAGQVDIDSQGNKIREYVPKAKNGNLFQQLLYQFDIPIVSSLVSMKHLFETSLNFDPKIHASEEYCLFMQLAVTTQFISLNQSVVKYRVHGSSLTAKTREKWASERRYTLNKIVQENKGTADKYKKGLEEAYARAAYYETQYYMSKVNRKEARQVIKKYKLLNWKYLCVFLLTFFPCFLWNIVQEKKYHREL